MKRISATLLVLTISIGAFSQEIIKKNELFLELGGNGLLGSVNYERQLSNKPGLGVWAGLGLYGTDTHLTIPVGLSYLIPVIKNHSFLDLGFGATYTKTDGDFYSLVKRPENYIPKKEFIYFIPSAGLRAYTTKNYVWRVNAQWFITESGGLPFIGIGFGKRF